MRYNSSNSCLRAQTASEVLFSDVAVSSQTSDQNYWTSMMNNFSSDDKVDKIIGQKFKLCNSKKPKVILKNSWQHIFCP